MSVISGFQREYRVHMTWLCAHELAHAYYMALSELASNGLLDKESKQDNESGYRYLWRCSALPMSGWAKIKKSMSARLNLRERGSSAWPMAGHFVGFRPGIRMRNNLLRRNLQEYAQREWKYSPRGES